MESSSRLVTIRQHGRKSRTYNPSLLFDIQIVKQPVAITQGIYAESRSDDAEDGGASLAGFEPATRCLEGSRSVQLSYRDQSNLDLSVAMGKIEGQEARIVVSTARGADPYESDRTLHKHSDRPDIEVGDLR